MANDDSGGIFITAPVVTCPPSLGAKSTATEFTPQLEA
jgi:hypothetical protein